MGDGELQEGQVWEGFMYGANNNIDNFNIVNTYNNLKLETIFYTLLL